MRHEFSDHVALVTLVRFDVASKKSTPKYCREFLYFGHLDVVQVAFELIPVYSLLHDVADVSNAGVLVQAFESLRDKADGLVVDTLTLPSGYSL